MQSDCLRQCCHHSGPTVWVTLVICTEVGVRRSWAKMASTPEKTRRWDRMPVDLPVRVVTSKGFATTVVEGRGTELSQGGMTLYAGILLNPGDLLEIEFDTPTPSRMPAIVRSRNGFCFGLEFITPLPS